MRATFLALLLTLGAMAMPRTEACAAASAASTGAAASFHDAHRIRVLSVRRADARVVRLTVSTPALAGHVVRISILLPTGYNPARRYPVLYLFHGTSGGADDWLEYGNAERTTAGLAMITVMPDEGFDGDGGGWFTDWVDQHTSLGPSQWESFNIDELIPFVEANLPTIANRSGRAIAGLSQGGYGAFGLAARHPDLFSVAASFSGAVDIGTNPVLETVGRSVIATTELLLDGGVEPDAAFGPTAIDELNFLGHDPGTLVTNLEPLKLYLWTGNGLPGPLDPPGLGWLTDGPTEALIHAATTGFAAVATSAGVAYDLDDYGNGTHSWPYWSRDLTQFVGPLAAAFAHPVGAPTRVDYRAVAARWTQWGWTVAGHRAAVLAWSRLSHANAQGFTLSGTGSATVTTAAFYQPGSVHTVWIGSSPARSLAANRRGQLTVAVSLGSGTTSVQVG